MNRRAKVFNLPNLITGSRFLLSGFLMVLLLLEQTPQIAWIAFWVFTVAAGSDWIDGYFARRYKSVTVLGKLMDPIADKLMTCGTLVVASVFAEFPWWATILFLIREIGITVMRFFVMERPGGKVIAAVSVSGPIERLTRQPGRLHAGSVMAAANRLTEVLRRASEDSRNA